MTPPPRRTAARRRRMLPRIVQLVLMALLAPIVAAGVNTIAASDAVAAAAPAGTLAPVPLVAPGGFEAALATLFEKIDKANRQAAKLAQQEKAVVAEAERITKESAAIRDSKTALNTRVAAVSQEISGHNKRAKALHGKIAAHNAKPNRFRLPAQAAAANAYDAEARQLEAEKSKENAVEDKIQGEESQIKQKASQVDARSSRLGAASKANDTKADGLRTKAQQLQSQSQQLLAQMSQVIQSFASAPSNPAAAMDRGGDAPAPAPQAGNRSVSQDEDTGDTPYRQPRTSALKQYAKQSGTTVDMRPGMAYLTPEAVRRLPAAQAAALGSPSVTYDGLVRKPNGHYTALRVRAPGTAALPAPAPEVLASGGLVVHQAGEQRVVDEVTSVEEAPSLSQPGPSNPPSPDPDPADCRSGFGGGWRTYLPVDRSGRAQGAEACLTKDFIDNNKGTRTAPKTVAPPAYRWAAIYAAGLGDRPAQFWRNACHLLAGSLGGSGTGYDNLATCSRTANSTKQGGSPPHHTGNMAYYEGEVRKVLNNERGVVVHYTVTPEYNGTRVVPTQFHMQATKYTPGVGAVTLFNNYVPNDIFSLKDQQWHNMGKDAPTEWEP
ncbi:DNA/RNA non-specific endonuclease [Streptomyces sp. NPDC059832]|uniref:DNA/RNA non-specific endonuclease n=1 Tax=Streptomyces sp. NPDC059832 TaxID=3346966 RepID=UPI00365C050E